MKKAGINSLNFILPKIFKKHIFQLQKGQYPEVPRILKWTCRFMRKATWWVRHISRTWMSRPWTILSYKNNPTFEAEGRINHWSLYGFCCSFIRWAALLGATDILQWPPGDVGPTLRWFQTHIFVLIEDVKSIQRSCRQTDGTDPLIEFSTSLKYQFKCEN